jgi:F0F1-type ATP synthase membrane subunit c/vacuolar-type H+-ATPase subunit K
VVKEASQSLSIPAMKRSRVLSIFYCILLLFAYSPVINRVQAQQGYSEGFAVAIPIEDKSVLDGSIVSLATGKFLMSEAPYDPSIIGVVTDKSGVYFQDENNTGTRLVTSVGNAMVRVSTINGVIKTGDLVTASSIKGVGQKATAEGYVLGVAQEDYLEKDPKKIGKIYVTLHLNFGTLVTNTRQNLIKTITQGSRSAFISPVNALRYITAGIFAIGCFIGGFWFFGRIAAKGVEAIGRNPLARKFILISVVMNVALTIVVMLLGVAVAYVILII